ncbi:heterokaryon incompatibility protein-domain-containing protein [Pisolithus croceorrhizus]|nr:heterokaryon incompatibility protein-domain-containing protein [Pisolithus croceorrhizus]KAI6134414.1 heterokaryon incompatibility protein-domain-containing protein [Pisolithus croceorrhizus]KAI6167829.1 heterokaryon incompatibility protein-domain-containing protein [Pisolithus thermaeus]
MRLLNVEAVLRREKNIETVDPESEIEVLEEHDDESTRYAIVSHRWGKEVTYKEMTRLHAMNPQKKEDVRKRGGYQKIIMGCKRAKKDGYMWLWIDTCCIDKRSSSELSEAINSMYRWYHNSEMCYVYLHDVDEREFPIKQDFSRFGKSSGWPEWFSRGWTLQELIAPKEVEFFNKDWVSIGTKEYLTSTLEDITRIPERVLNDEEVLGGTWSPERPCIARIMSWAANRKTTRVEDRAYSLLGLFDVNMPMLYGEGRKAFQRLQLEIIRASSDHSIFAWNPRALTSSYASILAEDPGWFRGCHDIEVVNHRIFAQEIEEHIVRRGEFAVAIDEDKLSSFRNIVDFTHRLHRWDVTNFGIHLSLPVLPERDRDYLCKAILPCRHRHGELITIDLSSHDGARCHRDNSPWHKVYTCPEFRPLYLHYSGGRGRIKGLRLKDKDASSCGFTRCGAFPCDGDVVTIPSQGDSLTVSVYSNNDAGCRFAVGLGFYVNNPCVRVVWDEYSAQQEVLPSWIDFAKQAYDILWNAPVPEGFLHKENVHLPRSIFHVDIYPYERRIRIKQCPGCCGKLGEREETRVFVTNRFGGGLFKPNPSYNGEIYSPLIRGSHRLQLSGQWLVECSGQKIELGDYGSFVDGIFICRGNILKDMQRLDIVHSAYDPVSSVVSGHSHVPGQVQNQCDVVTTCCSGKEMVLHLPRDRSLPRNEDFELLLRAFSMRLAGYALVTTVIECSKFYKVADDGEWTGAEGVPEGGGQSADSGTFTPLCSVVVPRPWRQHLARRQQFERIREHFYTVADPVVLSARIRALCLSD